MTNALALCDPLTLDAAMGFDLIILILCTYKLNRSRTQSGISKLLFRDGVIYFIAAFGANFLQMIFAAMKLNPVMNIVRISFTGGIGVHVDKVYF